MKGFFRSHRVAHPGRTLTVAVLALAVCRSLSGASGTVQTRNGTTIAGELRIERGTGLVLSNATGPFTTIPLSNLVTAQFNLPGTPANLVPGANSNSLPAPWQGRNIGPVGVPGRAEYRDNTFLINGSGTRIWSDGPDEFYFVCRQFSGNGQITALLPGLDARSAGIMLRKELTADAEFVLEGATRAGNGLMYRSRREPRQRKLLNLEGDFQNRDEIHAPMWLRLVRNERRIVAYTSWDNGLSWEHVFTGPDYWPKDIYAGLCVMGGKTNELKEATFTHVEVLDESAARTSATAANFIPRITLRNGSVLVGRIEAFDGSALKLASFGKLRTISTVNISWIVFQSLAASAERDLAAGRAGVLLNGGDFFEGEFRSLEQGQMTISSVLFGNHTFEVPGKVAGLVLRGTMPASGSWQVRTLDGSLLNATSIAFETDALSVAEPTLGLLRIALDQLAELTRPGDGAPATP